ncbi:MAG: hypothetical protein ACLP7P_03145 [Rhodomicrobium sp.]
MVRATAFVLVSALLILPVAPAAAEEPGNQKTAPQTEPEKPKEDRARSYRGNGDLDGGAAAERSLRAMPPASPRGDRGRPDDTVGGLPGHTEEGKASKP